MSYCQLPSLAGRPEDQLPKMPKLSSCAHFCPDPNIGQVAGVNNPCRYAKEPAQAPGHYVVCDYLTKQYYQQPADLKAKVEQYYDLQRQLSWYN